MKNSLGHWKQFGNNIRFVINDTKNVSRLYNLVLNKYLCKFCCRKFNKAFIVPAFMDSFYSSGSWGKEYFYDPKQLPLRQVNVVNIGNYKITCGKCREERFVPSGLLPPQYPSWKPFKKVSICMICKCGATRYIKVSCDISRHKISYGI